MSRIDGKIKKSFLYILYFFFLTSGSSFAGPIYQSKRLESFDSPKMPLKAQFKRSMLPANISGFELKTSNFIVHPEFSNGRSAIFRVHKKFRKYSWDLRFTKPILLDNYPDKLIFRIYTNSPGGTLYLLFRSDYGQIGRKKLTNLHFEGWQKVNYQFSGLQIGQNRIFQKSRSFYFLGFFYKPPQQSSLDRELFLALDDIILHYRKKYLFWKDLKGIK